MQFLLLENITFLFQSSELIPADNRNTSLVSVALFSVDSIIDLLLLNRDGKTAQTAKNIAQHKKFVRTEPSWSERFRIIVQVMYHTTLSLLTCNSTTTTTRFTGIRK